MHTKELKNLQNSSFLLLETIISLVIISIFLTSFFNLFKKDDILDPYIVFENAFFDDCKKINEVKNILNLDLRIKYFNYFDDIINKNIIVKEFILDNKIKFVKRCYEKKSKKLYYKQF